MNQKISGMAASKFGASMAPDKIINNKFILTLERCFVIHI